MQIYIASDHAGFEYKSLLISYLEKKQYSLHDCGTYSTQSVNYPEYAYLVCDAVLKCTENIGILLCGSGVGMSMYANRFKGIRAGLCTTEYQSAITRKHNNANIVCIGARVIGVDILYSIVDIFLTTQYEAGRHEKRVEQLDTYKI